MLLLGIICKTTQPSRWNIQTDVWMAYSCSMHFSEQLSYINYFIWSYRTQDMIFQSFILKMAKLLLVSIDAIFRIGNKVYISNI